MYKYCQILFFIVFFYQIAFLLYVTKDDNYKI